ncbi:SelB domain-containing protein [Geobacter pickeringii]|nr:SelB C-terminal domain-containing protein [Geobacter pickeringii]
MTGTLLAGEIRVGDEVELLPSGRQARVRGVQTHGRKGESATAGQRVAVNLQGVEHGEVARGDIVVPRGVYRTTRAVDARLDYLPSAPKELRHRATLRLHSATYEVPAQVILLDRDLLPPGESAFVQLRLKSPVLLLPGDPFVLRSYSPAATVGGGRVLDPMPPRHRRRSAEALELLGALGGGSDTEKVRELVAGSLLSGVALEEIAVRSGVAAKRCDAALAALLSAGEVVQAVREPRIFLSRTSFGALKELLLGEVEGYLRDNTLKDGIGKEELKTRLPRRSDPRFFGPLLQALEREGKVVVDRELVKLPGRKGAATVDQAGFQARIETALTRGGAEPPTVKELCEALRCGEKDLLEHLAVLVRGGRAKKVKGDLFYAPEPLAALREQLVALLREKGEITPPEFREITGLSRKFMIPLLEYFDQEKVTIRVGDKRVLRKG